MKLTLSAVVSLQLLFVTASMRKSDWERERERLVFYNLTVFNGLLVDSSLLIICFFVTLYIVNWLSNVISCLRNRERVNNKQTVEWDIMCLSCIIDLLSVNEHEQKSLHFNSLNLNSTILSSFPLFGLIWNKDMCSSVNETGIQHPTTWGHSLFNKSISQGGMSEVIMR